MKRINKALLIIATSLFLMGCNSNNNNPSTSETSSSSEPIHDEVFNVSFKDFDGKVIYVTEVKYGENATFEGELPKIPADLKKCYPFIGWDKSLENVTSDLEVNPLHGEVPNVSDFMFVSDCRVFQNAQEFNDETTNYIGYLETMGIYTFLREEVEVDGEVKSSIIIDYDDDAVKFNYSAVDLSREGDYPFSVSVNGFAKESTIKVVTDTREWTNRQKKIGGYDTRDPNLAGKVDEFWFYDDNKCIIQSTTYDEFYPLRYEMVEDNKAVIIRNEDGSIDCKYRINTNIDPYAIEGVKIGVAGVRYDSLQIFTEHGFTPETRDGYAYIVANLQEALFELTTKYEYNPDTKAVKLFASVYFNSLTYNADENVLVYNG